MLLLKVFQELSLLVREVFIDVSSNFIDFLLKFILVKLLFSGLSTFESFFKSSVKLLLLSAFVFGQLSVNCHD